MFVAPKGKRVKRNAGRVCDFASPPTDEEECHEAIWSQGGACKKCSVDCYRRGWSKELVTVDNCARVCRKVGA